MFLTCSMKTGVKKKLFCIQRRHSYGEQEKFPADESHSTNSISPYFVFMLASEKYLHYFYKTYGLEYIALRYANIYGPRQDPLGEAGVVAIFSSIMLKGGSPVINGDGNQTRDYVYVKDVVEANMRAIESNFVGCVNIGTSKETSVNELFAALKQVSGNNSIIKNHGPAKQGEAYRSSLDYSLAKKTLGWQPKTSVKEGLKLTFAWFKENTF